MVEIYRDGCCFHLRNERISYIIYLLESGYLTHAYFGRRLRAYHPASLRRRADLNAEGRYSVHNCSLNHTPQEYPSYGLGEMRDGALSVRRGDGTATCDLRYISHSVTPGKPALEGLPASHGENCQTLRIITRDDVLSLRVDLLYTIFDDCDIIARSALIVNEGTSAVELEKADSLCLDLPNRPWELITLSGDWARERSVVRRPLVQGIQGVYSLRGASSLVASPFMALADKHATETAGEVIAAALVYSGSFSAEAELDARDYVRLRLGLHPQHFGWRLMPGESFQTPEAVLCWSDQGLNGMSGSFHTLCAEHIVRGKYARAPRPILINNWEATYFDFNADKLLSIAKTAADVGVELFVLDDGWFGHRDDDHSSLGDWKVDRRKLPDGLKALAEEINRLGLRFGLWFEPEMVSPDSDLYRAHPDWAMQVAGRVPVEGRNQLILDLSRADVCEYIYQSVADILRSTPISYVKWDMNRNFSNIGSCLLPPERQRELPHRYMLGLYSVLDRLTRDFPEVLFESCSSGGGRFDLGMLFYMPQTWCSDDTDALCRCRIQWGTSMVFPPFAMGSHVSAVPNHQTGRITPLQARANVAMSGCFGFELDLNKLSDDELRQVREIITRVKRLRETLLYGRFYRLLSPFEGNDTAWLTVSRDGREAVLMLTRAQAIPNIDPLIVRLTGLEADADYLIEETGETYGGDELMSAGLCVALPDGDAASVSLTLRRIG